MEVEGEEFNAFKNPERSLEEEEELPYDKNETHKFICEEEIISRDNNNEDEVT